MQTIKHNNKTIHIVSTAHVSKDSIREVQEAIENIKPDVVCVELDRERAQALTNPEAKDIDLKQIIKNKKVASFLMNLILSNYQKQIAEDLETPVGGEMIQAMESAKEFGIPVRYIDRNVKITMNRIWGQFGLYKRANLVISLLSSLISSETIDEQEIEKLKESDLLMASIQELDDSYPEISEVILHERNRFMAQKINMLPQENILVVIGAAHAPGLVESLYETHDLQQLNQMIEKKKNKYTSLIIPGILFLLITILTFKSPQMAFEELLRWILLSSSFSAIGALLSGAHIATILVSFLTAFIGILSPVLAVGVFAGLTESYFRPPFAKEFASLSKDMSSIKGWYTNRVLKIVMIFFMTSILSSIGTFISGTNIIKSLFKIF